MTEQIYNVSNDGDFERDFPTLDKAEAYARKRCMRTGDYLEIRRQKPYKPGRSRLASYGVVVARVVQDAIGRVWTEVTAEGCALL